MSEKSMLIDITAKEVQKVAQTAHVGLSEQEVKAIVPELEALIRYVDQLLKVPTENVEPLYQPFDTTTPLRPDQPQSFPENLVSSSAEHLYDGYKVPAMMQHL